MLELIIHLLFIQPSGETYTEQERIETIQAVHDAAQFWGYDSVIVSTQFYTVTDDVYYKPLNEWSTVTVASQDEVYIFVVDNTVHKEALFGYGGYAQNYYRLIVVLNDRALDARIAHELGHIIYGLPDWYTMPGKCTTVDIMCDGEAAYKQNIKGCNTLDFIGKPCYRIYLPLVVVQYPGIANSGKIS